MLSEVGGTMSMPRVSSKMIHRGNIPSKTPEEYFRKNLFVPFVDHVRTQINDRFASHRSLLTSLEIILPCCTKVNPQKELETCKTFYEPILPDINTLEAEYSVW